MPKLSRERREARVKVLLHAAAWIEDQATGASSSETFENEPEDFDLLCSEAEKLAKKLRLDAEKSEARLVNET
ncbi:hypothetical protein [Vibrio sonorensis]|uniref:hypothetical protein n=1 Tax=Vibrio sonorensis TaxID=1004316 RepID=UPI0008D90A77|nr:hypothetical protein [Vibrio sonorensis]